jgi:hypothetical protein
MGDNPIPATRDEDDAPSRELFEALLSCPALGAAEALALLGTCTTARGVGSAASLRAVRAVAFANSAAEEAAPMVRALAPVKYMDEYMDGEEMMWPERSALPVVSGNAAKSVLSCDISYDAKSGTLKQRSEVLALSQLRALLRWCPNVVSLRLSSIALPSVGMFIANELGMASLRWSLHNNSPSKTNCFESCCCFLSRLFVCFFLSFGTHPYMSTQRTRTYIGHCLT